MTDIRTTLAEALPESLGPTGLRHRAVPQLGVQGEPTGYGNALLDRLLPVVEAIANQRAAEELERAADTAHGHEWWEASGDLYARAVALRSEESA